MKKDAVRGILAAPSSDVPPEEAQLILTSPSRTVTLAVGVCLGLLTPRPARAQTKGLRITPTFGGAVVYDDNILGTSDRRPDLIYRFVPALQADWSPTAAFSVKAKYSFEPEVFQVHPELNKFPAAQKASLSVQYRWGSRNTASANVAYTETYKPQDLFPDAGLELGRLQAVGYSASAGLSRRFGRADSLGIEYGLRFVDFAEEDGTAADFVTASWVHDLGRRTRFSIRAGPYFSELEEDVRTLVTATLEQQRRHFSAGLSYSLTRATVPQVGELGTEGITLALGFQRRRADLKLQSGVYRHIRANSEANVYGASLTARYLVKEWLLWAASYRHVRQRSAVGPVGRERLLPELSRNTAWVGFAIGREARLD